MSSWWKKQMTLSANLLHLRWDIPSLIFIGYGHYFLGVKETKASRKAAIVRYINLLATDFLFQILAHPVFKM